MCAGRVSVPLSPVCSMEWGGSNIRPEATGYGAVYFGEEVFKEQGDSFKVRVEGCEGCEIIRLKVRSAVRVNGFSRWV